MRKTLSLNPCRLIKVFNEELQFNAPHRFKSKLNVAIRIKHLPENIVCKRVKTGEKHL